MTAKHPCFDPQHAVAARRIHLPMAKNCNIQCRFCNRLYDCVNESRPGVTSAILAPRQALAYLEKMIDVMGNIDVVGIAGPGDAFAEPEVTLETLRLVHTRFPSMALCVSTNGLMIGDFAAQLANLGVTHASVTVNASDASVGAAILAWVRFNKKMFRGREAASLLMERQLSAITKLHDAGIVVKINTIVIPTVNESDIDAIARRTAMAGANVHNCIPFIPVSGSEFEKLQAPDHDSMQKARWSASSHLPQVRHCNRCRADAAGILGQDDPTALKFLQHFASLPKDPSQERPFIAVASREGALVNEHVGKAEQFYIYRRAGSGIELVEIRPAPQPGGLLERWRNLARVLHDCRALCASQIGTPPQAVLEEEGITVVITEGLIAEAVSAVFEGRSVLRPVFLKPCTGSSQGGGCA